MTAVKICGLSEAKTLNAAIKAGARYIGFVLYPPSPRHVEIDTAKELALQIPTGVRAVGLFVDPTDEQLEQTLGKVQLDMIQLHGDEPPARVAEIKNRFHMPLMKAIRVSSADDLDGVPEYETVADWLLFDSKPNMPPPRKRGPTNTGKDPRLRAESTDLPGGTGHSFDWNILSGRTFSKPWMLGGGLNTGNIPEALSILSPNALDVSSGVESARGVKDETKIKAFIEAAKAAQSSE